MITEGYCGYPPVPVNGEFPKAFPSSNRVTYKCKEGYKLVGQESNTCDTTTANWGSPPECRYKSTEVGEDASQTDDIDSARSKMGTGMFK
jgi:Sushi repeat (SCR repeat)